MTQVTIKHPDARRRVVAARTTLVMDEPFFGALAPKLKLVEEPDCGCPTLKECPHTAWTDGQSLGYWPRFVMSLKFPELVALLVHEVMHCAAGHPWRRDGRDNRKWNEACDRAINPELREAGYTLPPDVLFELEPGHKGKSAEWIYDRLPRPTPETPGSSGLANQRQQQGDREGGASSGAQSSRPNDGSSTSPQPGGTSRPGGSQGRMGQQGTGRGTRGTRGASDQQQPSTPTRPQQSNSGGQGSENDQSSDDDQHSPQSRSAHDTGRGSGGRNSGIPSTDTLPPNSGGNGSKCPQDSASGPGQGINKGPESVSKGHTARDHKSNSLGEVRDAPTASADPDEPVPSESDWQQAVQQAAVLAQGQGNMPASMKRFAKAAGQSRIDWRSATRRFAQEVARADYSFARPNPRYVASSMYLPSLRNHEVGVLAVGIDTSGSIDQVLLAQFGGELQAIADEVKPRQIRVLYADAVVQREDVFERGEDIVLHAKGGGGTDFRPVFKEVADWEEPPVAVIYLTDLLGTFPSEDPQIPTLWVTGNDRPRDVPFGELVTTG